jgi:hypothetical protein
MGEHRSNNVHTVYAVTSNELRRDVIFKLLQAGYQAKRLNRGMAFGVIVDHPPEESDRVHAVVRAADPQAQRG